ncbi:MAG: TonB-dependent receptor [Cyclobacteriaceae bacterium]
MKSITLITILTFYCTSGFSQSIFKGKVQSKEGEPLIGATVTNVLNRSLGTTTDMNGEFSIVAESNDSFIISYVGYKSDTVLAKSNFSQSIILNEDEDLLGAVTVESSSTFIDDLQPIHGEVITSKELLKAACCNLSESFETNASVDVSYTDAVSGTKMIRMLGLDGKYTLINRENLPNVRGLNTRAGLNYIPGTWIQSIDVGKGAGSVVNGYESIAGQINVELKKPEQSEALFLNGYINSFGRVELNTNAKLQLTEKWSTAFLLHGNYLNNEIDNNNDGFMDLPKSKQINFLNRYKFSGERLQAQIGIHAMKEEKAGGQLGIEFDSNTESSSLYGYTNQATRAEVFGKLGLLYPKKPYQGWGLIYSVSLQEQSLGFGRTSYNGQEKTIYTNLIHQNILGSTFHQYKIGGSLLVDMFDETFSDSTFTRNEVVPGAFLEYSFLPNDDITMVLGSRIDFHNLYGLYHSPRVHLRYKPIEKTTLRFAVGKGYRTSNIIMENTPSFISSRTLMITEELQPEEAWNIGGSVVHELSVNDRKLGITMDYFHTFFQNQVITDMDANSSQVRFYNLDGRSFAKSFQLETNYKITKSISSKIGYKHYDVQATINDQLQSVPMISKNRLFLNAGYSSKYEKWTADITAQWFGKKRLPDTSMKPEAFQLAPYSPDFWTINSQITRNFRSGSIYLGVENLLDFRQNNPIIDAANPFGNEFDASMSWGPIAGRMIYAGFRYTIN